MMSMRALVWCVRLLLWGVLLAGYALADATHLLAPSADLGTLRSDLLLWAAAFLGVELAIYGFERLLELIGEQIRQADYDEQVELFQDLHEDANEED